METIVYKVNRTDNVATAMEDIPVGTVFVTGAVPDEGCSVEAIQVIPFGHKIALTEIRPGDRIIKYGAAIGMATAAIAKGEYVHMHNMKSCYDERSAVLDPITAQAPDIEYQTY